MAVKEETAYQLVELVGNDTRFFVTPTHRMVGADDIPVLARDFGAAPVHYVCSLSI